MAYYYRKNVNDTVNDVKLKMQIGALTLKLSEIMIIFLLI